MAFQGQWTEGKCSVTHKVNGGRRAAYVCEGTRDPATDGTVRETVSIVKSFVETFI